MEQDKSIRLKVYTTQKDTLDDRKLKLLFGCDNPTERCDGEPYYVVLYDMRGLIQNNDGSVELYNVDGVSALACSEEHAKSILYGLMSDPEGLCRNCRTITVSDWLAQAPPNA